MESLREVCKGARITSRSPIVEGLSICVEESRVLAQFGELKGE
jgi:hypothetical protein